MKDRKLGHGANLSAVGALSLLAFLTAATPFFSARAGTRDQIGAPGLDDVRSMDGVIKALYESISFPAETGPDWDRFRELFSSAASPCIRMASDGVLLMDREGFIAFFDGRIKAGTLKSFAEREVGRTTEIYGGLAQVFSVYEKRLNLAEPGKPTRGINGIQLIFKDGRWWITSLAWQDELVGLPIPPQYFR